MVFGDCVAAYSPRMQQAVLECLLRLWLESGTGSGSSRKHTAAGNAQHEDYSLITIPKLLSVVLTVAHDEVAASFLEGIHTIVVFGKFQQHEAAESSASSASSANLQALMQKVLDAVRTDATAAGSAGVLSPILAMEHLLKALPLGCLASRPSKRLVAVVGALVDAGCRAVLQLQPHIAGGGGVNGEKTGGERVFFVSDDVQETCRGTTSAKDEVLPRSPAGFGPALLVALASEAAATPHQIDGPPAAAAAIASMVHTVRSKPIIGGTLVAVVATLSRFETNPVLSCYRYR